MPVVSNTSPLLNLAIIEHLFLLPQQFGQIYIPTAVLTELRVEEDLPGSAALKAALDEGWLMPQTVRGRPFVALLGQTLHQGEAEAIALAVEISAERILLDEKEARRAAKTLELNVTGILGILLKGWRDGNVSSMSVALNRLRTEANFWIAPALVARVLRESGEPNKEQFDS